jgi:hypothetical protein
VGGVVGVGVGVGHLLREEGLNIIYTGIKDAPY